MWVLSAQIAAAWMLFAVAAPRQRDVPRETLIKGEYTNAKYLYRVKIPPGISAVRSAAPAPNHGFGIVPSQSRPDKMWVTGEYDAAFAGCTQAAALQQADGLRDECHLAILSNEPSKLSTLDAREIVMRGNNGPGKVSFARFRVAYRPLPRGSVGIVYSLGLLAESEKGATGLTEIFERIANSFRLESLAGGTRSRP